MKIFMGLVALVLTWAAVLQMANDNWGPGFLLFGLGIVAIHLIPQDRSSGSWISLIFRK
jgi:predicted acyltransferase